MKGHNQRIVAKQVLMFVKYVEEAFWTLFVSVLLDVR